MGESRASLGVLCVVAIVTGVAAIAVGVTGVGAIEDEPIDGQFLVELESSGDAEVEISAALNLTDDEQRESFEQLEDDESVREAIAEGFREDMQFVSREASRETDRELIVGEVTVETERDGDDVGVVTYRFRWEALAAVDDGRVVLAEPFSLYDELDRELVVVAPEDHELVSVTPEPDESNATRASWAGFTPLDGFEVVTEAVETDDEDEVDQDDDATEAEGDGAGFGVIIAVAALVTAGLLARARRG